MLVSGIPADLDIPPLSIFFPATLYSVSLSPAELLGPFFTAKSPFFFCFISSFRAFYFLTRCCFARNSFCFVSKSFAIFALYSSIAPFSCFFFSSMNYFTYSRALSS
jgi:hypothetical protein